MQAYPLTCTLSRLEVNLYSGGLHTCSKACLVERPIIWHMHTHSASNAFFSHQAWMKQPPRMATKYEQHLWAMICSILTDPAPTFQFLQSFQASNTTATHDNVEHCIGCRIHGGGSGHWTPWIHLHSPWAQISNCLFGSQFFQSLCRLQMAASNHAALEVCEFVD